MTLIAGEKRENILRWFGNMSRDEMTREIVEKIGKIKIEGNRRRKGRRPK